MSILLNFRVLFGPPEERPSSDTILNYMLATHVRLFRDLGLNETHFDVVAKCFVGALQDCGFSQYEVEECVSIVGPLRVAFAYGSKVAELEKQQRVASETETDTSSLPTATMQTMRSNTAAVLPPAIVPPSQCLVDVFHGDREQLRAWTCHLTQRFVVEDEYLRPLFQAIPYMDMEPYLHAFLQLAFCDEQRLINPRQGLQQ